MLSGTSALITGASRGIGEAIAIEMARAGADVVLASRSTDKLEAVASTIRAAGGRATVMPVDLTDRAEVMHLADAASHVDVLVNNAGNAEVFAPLVSLEDEHWERTFAVDFWAPMVLTREIGKRMMARGRGSILNISSIVGTRPAPLAAAYATSKAALDSLTKVTAMEFAAAGVRCNALAPGIIATELTEMMKQTAAWDHYRDNIPLGRAGELGEVAALAVWLSSGQASFVTGQIINVDGGATAGDHGLLGAVTRT